MEIVCWGQQWQQQRLQIADIKKSIYNLLAGFFFLLWLHINTKQLNLIISSFPTGLFFPFIKMVISLDNHHSLGIICILKQWNYKVKSHKNVEEKRVSKASKRASKQSSSAMIERSKKKRVHKLVKERNLG